MTASDLRSKVFCLLVAGVAMRVEAFGLVTEFIF